MREIIESCRIASMASNPRTKETCRDISIENKKRRDMYQGQTGDALQKPVHKGTSRAAQFSSRKNNKRKEKKPKRKKEDNKSKNNKMIELRGRLHGHLQDETNEDSRKYVEVKSSTRRGFQVMMPVLPHSIMRSQSNGEKTRQACALSSFMRQEQWGQQERPQHC